MTYSSNQLLPLDAVCEDVEVMSEGGRDYIYLCELRFRVDDVSYVLDALLCPQAYNRYKTRLFLSQPIPGRGRNWTTHQILSRTWHSCSWQGVPADLPLLEMVLTHLGAFR